MSRLLDLPRGFHTSSTEAFFAEPVVEGISRHIRNGEDLQILDQNSAEYRNNSQRNSNKNSIHGTNTTINIHKSIIPLPDWPVALNRWGLLWDFHIYGFSVLYLILVIVSALIYFRFRLRVNRFKIVFNTLILLATSGVFRSVLLLVDAYGHRGNMAGLMVGILTQAVYPLFCAGYGLTQVMLVRIAKVDVGHSRFRTLSCLLGCTLTYLFLIVVIETLVFYERSLKLLLILDNSCFIVWSLLLGVTFICSGFRLSQSTKDSEGAAKDLDDGIIDQNSTNNTPGFRAIPSNTTDTSINVFSVDLTSTTLDITSSTKTTATSIEVYIPDGAIEYLPPVISTSTQSFQTTALEYDKTSQHPQSGSNLPNHIILSLATDDDDKSTSSTDVDKPQTNNTRKQKRARKRSSKRHALIKNHNKPKSTIPSSSRAALLTKNSSVFKEPVTSSRKRHITSSNKTRHKLLESASSNYTSLSGSGVQSCQQQNPAKQLDGSAPSVHLETAPGTKHVISSELPLLASSYLLPRQKSAASKNKYNESVNEICDDDGDDNDATEDITNTATNKHKDSSNCVSDEALYPALRSDTEAHLSDNNKYGEYTVDILEHNNEYPDERNCRVRSASYLSPMDCDQTRENGYLADTETAMSRSSLSKSNIAKRHISSRSETISFVSSSRRSTSSSTCDDDEYDDSTASPELSDRRRSSDSVSLGSLFGKQIQVVQRSIYLTYALTFQFLFACLLQLYTVFGVYGVMGTIPIPDPWPWFIFQSIFRLTEVCIGLTIATIAFLVLNLRHQRSKRRHQKQQQLQQHQHVEVTGDCIV